MIELRLARPEDAVLLAKARCEVWKETYRGIYPDEMLDDYDVESYALRDHAQLLDPRHHYYLYLDNGACVGYFSFGPSNYGSYKDFSLCLNHLYIRSTYQGRGLGKLAFKKVWEYCEKNQIRRFFCGCNAHNHHARNFYIHMGGIPGDRPEYHDNKADDILHYEFYQREVTFRKAELADAPLIAATRQKAWAATYRGIYPNAVIDDFDAERHTLQDQKRISRENVQVWLVMDGSRCAGYYTFGDVRSTGEFWLLSLYLLPEYQRRGIGRMIFALICEAGRAQGHCRLLLDCSPHNQNAMAFYTRLGGIVSETDVGHDNLQEDSCYFEFLL